MSNTITMGLLNIFASLGVITQQFTLELSPSPHLAKLALI